ncbi:uncharacterized protein TNCV_3134261 [Trichonephila clavipes]|nr:uncharacterized protein TNCV_3134261 [Trichonephila clavipes]
MQKIDSVRVVGLFGMLKIPRVPLWLKCSQQQKENSLSHFSSSELRKSPSGEDSGRQNYIVVIVCREYRESGKTANVRHHCGRKKNKQEWGQRRLTRIVQRDIRATLPQIAANFSPGPSTSVIM